VRIARVDLCGLAWVTLDGHPPPQIYADLKRNYQECTGVLVGIQVTRSSSYWTAVEIAPEPDAVFVPRLTNEPFYSGFGGSLVQRVAQLHGTDRVWSLVYPPPFPPRVQSWSAV